MTILLVGNTRRREFREVRAAVDAGVRVVEAADLEAASSLLAEGEHAFDLIVLAAAYPGQFSAEGVERLRRLSPLSRVVALSGSWCEGELRSGHPVPGAVRVYWHQWGPRIGRESARWLAGLRSSWGLPATATEEERVLTMAEEPCPRRSGLIAVCSGEPDVQEWICDACRRAGYAAVRLRPGDPPLTEQPSAAIFDGSDEPCRQIGDLRRFAAKVRPAPVIALLGFPRQEDRDALLAAGASALLSKPLFVQDLFWQLDACLGFSQGD